MKQFFFLLTLILGFAFSAQAAGVATPNYGSNTITVGKTIGEPNTKKATTKKNVFAKIGQWFKKAETQDLLFYALAILLGAIGIHRLVAGSEPMIILWYILVAVGIGLAFTILTVITGGLFALLGGWLIFWILPILDIIKALIKGVSHFEGNNDVFASLK
jgi:hypothetical protein